MLRNLRVERIRRERVAAGQQFEALGRHDQMQISGHAAHGAIAFGDGNSGGRDDFEADAAAMAAACVGAHVCRDQVRSLMFVL